MKLLADTIDFGQLKGVGPLGSPTDTGITNFQTVISSAIGVMTIVAFIWFVFVFITGAIGIISSGGDKTALESASKRITNGIIGVVVVIAAIAVVSLLGTIFGIEFLNISKLFSLVSGGSTP